MPKYIYVYNMDKYANKLGNEIIKKNIKNKEKLLDNKLAYDEFMNL